MDKCINLLKISINKNKKGFIVLKNNKNLNILKVFIKLNILKFLKIDKNSIIAYINYVNNKPIFKNIVNMFKTSSKNYITLKELKNIENKKNWIFILSTSKGIISSFDAIRLNIGGLLIAVLWN